MAEHGPCEDHDCMEFRHRHPYEEGDDTIIESCAFCGRIRHETDGIRPMAWYIDPTNPSGHRYVHQPPRNDPNKPTIWKFPPSETGERNG